MTDCVRNVSADQWADSPPDGRVANRGPTGAGDWQKRRSVDGPWTPGVDAGPRAVGLGLDAGSWTSGPDLGPGPGPRAVGAGLRFGVHGMSVGWTHRTRPPVYAPDDSCGLGAAPRPSATRGGITESVEWWVPRWLRPSVGLYCSHLVNAAYIGSALDRRW